MLRKAIQKRSAQAQVASGHPILVLGPHLMDLAVGPLGDAEMGVLDDLAGPAGEASPLILVDADAWETDALVAAIAALAERPAAAPVLLVGRRLATPLVRTLLRLPRSDVLEAPFSDEQLAAAAKTLMTPAAPPQAASGASRCWAVTGAVGGAGATTVAIEIATALAARTSKRDSVCLIDLNLADGAAAAYLGASPAMRLADFSTAPERIDAAILRALVTAAGPLALLAAHRQPDAFETVSAGAILRLLDVASETYDWVILDMPRHRRSWTLEALSGCDEVLVVSELTVPALMAARALTDELEAAGPRPRIVLNRLAARMFGPAPSMAEAERALQRKADGGISSDWEAAAASVNLGGPIAQHRPKSKIVKDIQLLVEHLAAQPARLSQAA